MVVAFASPTLGTQPPERDGDRDSTRYFGVRTYRNILVVEDEPEVAGLMADLLRAEGYEVLLAQHGQEALDRLHGHVVDLIVLDLRLPVMDGWKFRTIQRSHPRFSHIPVIAVSADGSPQAEAIDADYYLAKPFEAQQLLVAIERLLLADRRKQLDDQLKEAGLLTTLGTIAATVGHEINNPLTYVLGNIQMLEQRLTQVGAGLPRVAEGRVVSEMTEMLRDVRIGAERIREVVSTLQALSQTTDVPTSLVDVRSVIRTCIGMAWNEIRHRAPLRTDLKAVPLVAGNEVRLGQVVLNLLINAAQSIPTGSYESHEVQVSTWASGDQVIIEVSDTGVGIPPELQDRVFAPFFTTKGKLKGTGIGLTVSRNIIVEHGGRIELRSRPGAGTTFRVQLPAHRGSSPPLAASDDSYQELDPGSRSPWGPGSLARGTPGAGQFRLLLIDDDALVLSAMARMLSQEHVVEKAGSAPEALRLLATGSRFDAIVCDMVMPEMTGMQFWAEVEKRYQDMADRIVFVTGAALMPEVQAFREQNQNVWVEKPFALDSLREAIRETIRRSDPLRLPP